MGIHVLRSVTQELQKSPYLIIMADETMDVSSEEQLVHEEFFGLYKVPNIEAATIFGEIQDVLKELNIPVAKLRGQCYDSASAMSSSKRSLYVISRRGQSIHTAMDMPLILLLVAHRSSVSC